MIEIDYLCDHSNFASVVTRWIYDVFIYENMPDLLYENFHSFFQNCGKVKFPIRLVAISEGLCTGTVSIVDNDLSTRNYTPWLGGFYVDAPYRNIGIGQNLINAVKRIVKDMGYKEIYLSTRTASQYYRKLGWQFVERCDDEFGNIVEVFRCEINNNNRN